MTELRIETLTLPGAPLGDENPLPYFRDPQPDHPVHVHDSVPPQLREHLGWQAAFRVLPYRMQDGYSRARSPQPIQTLVLENEHLRATFAPQLGGRLLSLVDTPHDRELLFRNPVFQPANLAIRNAWFAGGIEWNIGQFGHTFNTCAPLFAAEIRGAQGEPGLRLYEFERCKRLFWQIDCYLPPGSRLLITYARVVNPNDEPTAMYWWTNIAVPEAPGVRALAPADHAVYIDFTNPIGYGYTALPGLPSLGGEDGTYALNSTFANEFFFQCEQTAMPWEAAVDAQGQGMFEASSRRMRYRKQFCWGTHQGGRRWQEFLAQPGMAYLEIQAGLAPTQLHGLPMPARTTWDWLQVFGSLAADPAQAHSADWPSAVAAVDQAVQRLISPGQLAAHEQSCRALADSPARLLGHGAGWGALELRRRARDPQATALPPAFVFPDATLGPEQAGWLGLLEHGLLAAPADAAQPSAWLVQPEWRALLEASLGRPGGHTWQALLHLGVMRLEDGDEAGAAAAWRESIRLRPTAWAERNLAVLAQRQGQADAARAHYARAWALAVAAGQPPAALAAEYLRMLCDAGRFAQALEAYQHLPAAGRVHERVQMLHGWAALMEGDLDTAAQALEYEYAGVREGETNLTDLWFELCARRLARATGRPLDAALRAEAARLHPPPSRIDFRLVGQ